MEINNVYRAIFYSALLLSALIEGCALHQVNVDIDRPNFASKYEYFLNVQHVEYEKKGPGHFVVFASSIEDEHQKMKPYYYWEEQELKSEGVQFPLEGSQRR